MRTYTTIALLLSLAVAPVLAFANEGSESTTPRENTGVELRRGENKFDVESRLREKKGQLETVREQRVERVKEVRSSLQENEGKHLFWKGITLRAYKGIAQIDALANRLESYIEKLKAEESDVATAETQKDTLDTSIATAKTKFANLKTLAASIDDKANMTAEQETALTTAKEEVRTAIKKVHEDMRALLKTLRTYKPVRDDKVTPNAEVNESVETE